MGEEPEGDEGCNGGDPIPPDDRGEGDDADGSADSAHAMAGLGGEWFPVEIGFSPLETWS